jgi:hypothetical protein
MKSNKFSLLVCGVLLAQPVDVPLSAAIPPEIGQSSASERAGVEEARESGSWTDFDSESGTTLSAMLESPASKWVEFDQPEIEAPNSGRNWDDNLRVAIELSSRYVVLTHGKKNFSQQFLGIDLHKVLVGPDGDWGTFMFQGYLTRINNQERHPAAFESDNDWEMVYRIWNLNYTALADGKMNFKLGRFFIPYGLEHDIDSAGQLLDYMSRRNLGPKIDWGATINGVLPHYQYEIALSRGTGIEYTQRNDPYIVSGRISTPPEDTLVMGLSGFHGRVANAGAVANVRAGLADPADLGAVGSIVRRTRFGVDVAWYSASQFAFLGEASVGRDYWQDVVNGLAEVNWNSQDETVLLYLQARFFNQRFAPGWDDAFATRLGVRYKPDNHWDFSAQYIQNISAFRAAPHDAAVAFQIRYRY